MKRVDDWPERLAEFIRLRMDLPFEWGRNDCALLACDAALAQTGKDLAAEFRGRYWTHAGAIRAQRRFLRARDIKPLRRKLLEQVAETIAAEFGLEDIPPAFARRGDVVLAEASLGPTLGFIGLDGTHAFAPSELALHKIAITQCRRAWRI